MNEIKNERQVDEATKPTSPDPMQMIRKMAQLRDEGILTEDEFQAKKAQLLDII